MKKKRMIVTKNIQSTFRRLLSQSHAHSVAESRGPTWLLLHPFTQSLSHAVTHSLGHSVTQSLRLDRLVRRYGKAH